MPLSLSYPGLYIQEVPSNSNAIVPAPTSIAAFVGYSHPFKTSAFNVAQQCFSFNDYVSYFGPLFSSGLVDASLPRAVSQFFLNGGSSAWVVGLQPSARNAAGGVIVLPSGANPLTIMAATSFVSAGTSGSVFYVQDTTVAPTLSSLAPNSVAAGAPSFNLTVIGSNFTPGCKVYWNGADLGTTVFVNAQNLTATVPASGVATVPTPPASQPEVTVVNPAAGTTSGPSTFTIAPANLAPTVTSLVPNTLPATSPGFTLTINGNDFAPEATVNWTDSSPHTTALPANFVNINQVTVSIPSSLVATLGTPTLTVVTPAGQSASTPFIVASIATTPKPSVSNIGPANAPVGSGGFTLTVTGANFLTSSVIEFGGTQLTPETFSPTQLTATVPASSLNVAGAIQVSVQNGSGATAAVSTALTFTVYANYQTPTVSSVSPPSGPASGAAFTLSVTGTNFTTASVVYWNGVALPTTFVSDTVLQAAVPAADIASGGSVSITVSNPGATGIVFTALELTDQAPMQATIAGVRNGGQTFDLTITYGTQFESYRNLQLLAPTSRLPDQVINGVSQLVTVAPAAGGYGTSIAPQQLSLAFNQPAGFSTCFREADFLNPPAPTVPIFEPNSTLDNLEIFNLLIVPGVSDFSVLSAALAFAERKRAFAIVDLPQQAPAFGSAVASPQPAEAWMEGLGSNNGPSLPVSPNGAVYYPYLVSKDIITGNNVPMAPSGFVAGLYAQTDATRGVWKAPAGLAAIVQNSTGPVLTGVMNDPQQGVLNLDSINCLRTFSGVGTVVWGARTLVAQNNALQQWKYVPVRRMTLFIEQTLLANLRWVVFEPNDEPLWIAITASISAFLLSLFKQGALQGSTPSQAFQVTCDSTTTTPQDQINGVVNIVVAFAPLKPAEFVVINIAQLAGQTAGS